MPDVIHFPRATKDKTRTAGEQAGLGMGSGNQQPGQCSQDARRLQEIGQEAEQFNRLQRAFEAQGWGFYPLSEGTYLATRWGMTRVLPDLRAASQMLRLIGGAR